MPFGVFDTQYIDLAQNYDRSYIEGITNASGATFDSVLQSLDERLAAFNGTVDPLIAALASPTREAFVEYIASSPFKVSTKGEYGMARPQQGEESGGHMLPVRYMNIAIGWTEDGLRRMRSAQIEANLDGLLQGFRNQFRRDVLWRMFSDAEVVVEHGQSTALSPGFAGSGTSLNVYTRPYPTGAALPGGYTHYIRAASAGRAAAILSAIALLKKQGHAAPYDLIASANEIDAITADTANFVGAGSALIRPAPDQAEALVDGTLYLGVFGKVIRVREAIDDFTDSNIAVFKTYGALDPRNPLAIRFPDEEGLPDRGKALYVRSRNFFPLAEAESIAAWGVGPSQSRTNGVLISIAASGSYTPPTL